jgi:DNA-binding response OmpR family regulator
VLVGSTFEIFLPSTTETDLPQTPDVAPLPATPGHETIILIEEDEVVRKMVAGMLTADGYRVTAAPTTAEIRQEPEPARSAQLLIAPPTAETGNYGRRLLRQNSDLCFVSIRKSEATPKTVAWLPADHQTSLLKPYALSELLRATRKLLDARPAPAPSPPPRCTST